MAEPKTGSEHGARKATRGASNSTWRKMFACCVKAEEDDVQVLDYEHSSLSDVPAEVFAHERTLEVLRLDCNQISDLPRPLFHCHGLKELYLSDNEIAQLPPALASLIHLQVRLASCFMPGAFLKRRSSPPRCWTSRRMPWPRFQMLSAA